MKPVTIIILLSTLAQSLVADIHLGPVSDIEIVEDKVCSCSQAGVFEGAADGLQLLVRPSIRVTRIATLVTPQSHLLVFAGGRPALEGAIGSIALQPSRDEKPRQCQLAEDLLYDVAVSPDQKIVAVAGADGKVRISDPTGLREGKWTVRHTHTAAARAVTVSPDGKWLASAGLDGVLMISALGTDNKPRQLLDHTAGIECLVFSPDSQFLASGSLDSKVRLHEVSGKLVRTYHGLGMEDEPVAGRVASRVLSLVWQGELLLAGTSKGSLHGLSQTDDTVRDLRRSGTDPIYSLAVDRHENVLMGTQGRLQLIPWKELTGP